MKYLFLILLLNSCAHFVKDTGKLENTLRLKLSSIEIQDQQVVEESISSKDKVLHRNEFSYTSGQSMHEELSDMEKVFDISPVSKTKLKVVYKRNAGRSAWKIISFITLTIIPFWENTQINYTFTYEEDGKSKTFSRDYQYKSIYSIVLLPMSFSFTTKEARSELAKIAATDFANNIHNKKSLDESQKN